MTRIRRVFLTTAGIVAFCGSAALADGPVEPRHVPRGHNVAGTRVSAPVGQTYNRARIQTKGHTAPFGVQRVPYASKAGLVKTGGGFGALSNYPLSYQVLNGSSLSRTPRAAGWVDTRKANNDIRRLIRKLDLAPM